MSQFSISFVFFFLIHQFHYEVYQIDSLAFCCSCCCPSRRSRCAALFPHPTAAAFFTWRQPPDHPAAVHLCTWGCAGTALFGFVQFGSVIFFSDRSPFGHGSLRPCLLTCFAALLPSSLHCSFAGVILCLLHSSLLSHRVLHFFSLALFSLLTSSLVRSQRGSHLRCAP